MNKILLSSGALFHLALKHTFEIARGAGFDGVEIILDEQNNSTSPNALIGLSKAHDVPVMATHMPMSHCAVFGDRADSIIKKSIVVTHALQATKLIVHPDRKNNAQYEKDIINVVATHPSSHPVQLLLENMPLRTTTQAQALYNPTAISPYASGMCLDTSHLATSRLDFKDTVLAVLPIIKHVHLSDSNIVEGETGVISDDHLPFGDGKLPLAWLVRQLTNAQYKGYYCMELRPQLLGNKSVKDITTFLEKIIIVLRSTISG